MYRVLQNKNPEKLFETKFARLKALILFLHYIFYLFFLFLIDVKLLFNLLK